MKYTYTSHTPGHILLPELDKEGKVVMVLPDAEAVAAAQAANAKKEKAVKRLAGANASKVRVSPAVIVPKAESKIDQDIFMERDGVYDLPEKNEDVKHYVMLGYLVPVAEPAKEMKTEKSVMLPKPDLLNPAGPGVKADK